MNVTNVLLPIVNGHGWKIQPDYESEWLWFMMVIISKIMAICKQMQSDQECLQSFTVVPERS